MQNFSTATGVVKWYKEQLSAIEGFCGVWLLLALFTPTGWNEKVKVASS